MEARIFFMKTQLSFCAWPPKALFSDSVTDAVNWSVLIIGFAIAVIFVLLHYYRFCFVLQESSLCMSLSFLNGFDDVFGFGEAFNTIVY